MHTLFRLVLTAACLLPVSPLLAQRGCDPNLWDYVYNKKWLDIKKSCLEVRGTIYNTVKEPDGNIYIRLSLDAGQEKLLNERNMTEQYGCLPVVAICATTVSLPDAVDICEGFDNHVRVPAHGTHVKVTGTYVYNHQHGWYELHPVTSIEVIH